MMKQQFSCHVLALYSLANKAGRDHFHGLLNALSDNSDWHLSVAWPELYFARHGTSRQTRLTYDGYIISVPGPKLEMKALAESQVPTVLVNITDPDLSARTTAISFVWTDNADIGRSGAEHLLQRGDYESVGYVHDLKYEFYSYEREIAFRMRMKNAGYNSQSFPADSDFRDYQNRLRIWLKNLPKPAAVMAVTDTRAADIINICRVEHIAVPEQVAVVGVDNDLAQHEKCGMGISSVLPDFHLMGQLAVRELDFLFKRPKRQGRPHEILVPVKEVIARESSARSLSAASLVKHGLAFIQDNRNRNLRRKDVVAHLGCSLQLAELRFRQIAGMTIRAAIEKARLEEVAHRLKSSNSSVRQIAAELHFNSASHLSRIYRRHFGHTIRISRSDKPSLGIL